MLAIVRWIIFLGICRHSAKMLQSVKVHAPVDVRHTRCAPCDDLESFVMREFNCDNVGICVVFLG